MDESKRQDLIKSIVRYSEHVNGFKPQRKHFDYWNSLDDYTLQKVYRKWQELYSAVVFTTPEDWGGKS